ncbi:alpha-ketoglutarate catabolism dioxygenase [Suhomyces tanzawaensis NRRL Y-17324]|uniref:Alpha-ketoglutarate catabolism dioxygenase n=1 Tax=Suhomyces tanzawaensis NRRL Y-17324 TaxID=984487 RepID=A0A1E4SEM8_9ASCO|nr:alpha-ketoglutarate catabolism dioxygenase [Suhomyces tanzawaensis NRRL Y-17324]ODV77916.1 alpha-ketoglutarate catabolism dioxygenase [Suhomyces tanzawaensis NRRL Y-17324]
MSTAATQPRTFDFPFFSKSDEITEDGVRIIGKENREKAKYPEFLPTWDPSQKYPPIAKVEYIDPGTRADPLFANLLPKGGSHTVKKITPKFGSEISGIQLSSLSDAAKDELALLIAQRGVVVLRDQDFASKGPQFVVDYGKYFGRLHIHPTSGAPKGFPELHIVYKRPEQGEFGRYLEKKNTSTGWHSDVAYEYQPPGYTFFSVVEGPEAGGDTLYADTTEAYNRLSPDFQKRLEGLHVEHSSYDQATNSRHRGGVERRTPVTHHHPLVRVHPVTGAKSIYISKGFTKRIVEYKEEESAALLDFLFKHISGSHDLQLRASWEPNTVVIWDNRRTNHSICIDFDGPVARHAFRVTTQAERPVADLKDLNVFREDDGNKFVGAPFEAE